MEVRLKMYSVLGYISVELFLTVDIGSHVLLHFAFIFCTVPSTVVECCEIRTRLVRSSVHNLFGCNRRLNNSAEHKYDNICVLLNCSAKVPF